MAEQALTTTAARTDAAMTMEQQLEQSGKQAIETAKALTIASQQDYELGGKYLTDIKARMNQIEEYWKGPKQAAQKAHKELVEREKQMLKPLKEAMDIIKKAMLDYQAAVDRARREAEAAARRQQEEEAMRLVDQAAQAEANGDDQTAAIHMAMAEMVSEMPAAPVVEAPTAAGTSIRRTWKARVIDAAAVPAYANGMEIRPISMSALNNIAKMTKGTMQIPGVEFYLDATMGVRG